MSIVRRKKRLPGKLQKQIHMPKFCQQPRSRRGSKPRTDFSLFISSSAASSSSSPSSSSSSMLHRRHPGATSECSRYRNGQFQIAASSLEQTCQAVISRYKKEMPSFPLVQCNVVGGQEKNSSNSTSVQIPQAESVKENLILENWDDRNRNLQESGTGGELASTPCKSILQVVESNAVGMSAGSVVWAKTDDEMWWPAKIMEGKSTADVSSDQGPDGYNILGTTKMPGLLQMETFPSLINSLKKGVLILWQPFKML